MFKVIVEKAHIEVKSGISKRTGQSYSIPEQEVFVLLPNGEKRRITLAHEAGAQPLPVGEYEPGPKAGYVGKFGSLEVSTRAHQWQPVASAAAKLAVAK